MSSAPSRSSTTSPSKAAGAILVVALMALAMGLYFAIAHDGRPGTSTRTFLDDGLPLLPGFVWIYLSIYLAAPLLALGASAALVRAALLRCAVLLTLTFGCFLLFPTVVERPDLSGLPGSASVELLRLVYAIDTPARNAAPSGHVSLTMLIAWVAWRTLPRAARAPVVVYATLVSVSIVLVGQHHVVDLLTGALIGAIVLGVRAPGRRARPPSR